MKTSKVSKKKSAPPTSATATPDEKSFAPTAETPCIDAPNTQESGDVTSGTDAAVETAPDRTEAKDTSIMQEITFTRSDRERKSQAITYVAEGYNGSVRFSKTLFNEKMGPPTVSISLGEFRAPRKEETKEERKARLKAAPKPTLEQQIAKDRARLAKKEAKLAAQAKSQAA